jgi:hypothetical protein
MYKLIKIFNQYIILINYFKTNIMWKFDSEHNKPLNLNMHNCMFSICYVQGTAC